MLTETQARDLLQQAADTIEVVPAEPLRPIRRPRTVLLAAAAAVALIAAGLGVAGLARHRDTPVAPPPPGGLVTVPSVFGYDATGAQRLLTDAGLETEVDRRRACTETPGRALGTEPAHGAQVSAGTTVTLVVSDTDALHCSFRQSLGRFQAWALVDLATGSGRTPTFARQVTLQVDDDPAVTVSGTDATDPALWPRCAPAARCPGSALDAITSQLARADTLPMFLQIRDVTSWSVSFTFDYPQDGIFAPPWVIRESLDHRFAVTGVHLDTHPGIAPDATPGSSATVTGPDPGGIGRRFVAFARGESRSLPVDTPVRLYLGHRYVATLPADQSSDRGRWRVCLRYAGVSCPFSAMRILASHADAGGDLLLGPRRVAIPASACRSSPAHHMTPAGTTWSRSCRARTPPRA